MWCTTDCKANYRYLLKITENHLSLLVDFPQYSTIHTFSKDVKPENQFKVTKCDSRLSSHCYSESKSLILDSWDLCGLSLVLLSNVHNSSPYIVCKVSYVCMVCRCTFAALAFRMVMSCWAMTDNTSMSIRLNSSKQHQAPDWASPLKKRPIIWKREV